MVIITVTFQLDAGWRDGRCDERSRSGGGDADDASGTAEHSALRPNSVVVDWTQLDHETTSTDGGARDPLLLAAQRALDDGDRAGARQHLQAAVTGGDVAAATFLLGVLDLADGARDDARRAWQRVLDAASTPWAPRAATEPGGHGGRRR